MRNEELIVGQKVTFDYYDHDQCKDVYGRGWIIEIDLDNNQILIQTTRKLHWCEPSGVHAIKTQQPK